MKALVVRALRTRTENNTIAYLWSIELKPYNVHEALW